MAKSVHEHPFGEVSRQELACPCGHKMGGHGLHPTQVSVDDDLLCRLQDPPGTALLRSDLTLIPPIHRPLSSIALITKNYPESSALLQSRSGGRICSLISYDTLMSRRPPKVDLTSLGHEGLDRLLNDAD